MPRMQAIEDDPVDSTVIDVTVDNPYNYGSLTKVTTKETDGFKMGADQVKKLRGLSPTFKRRISRDINKVQDSDVLNDARSKSIDPHYAMLDGYEIFNVVLPPYNMDYLAQIYEISAPHYAAVNAKTANIVGLGYTWVETSSTQDILDAAADNQTKLAKVRKKLEKAKQVMTDWLDDTNKQSTFTETMMAVWVDLEATGNGYIEIGRKSTGEIGYIGHIPSVTMRIRTARDGYVQLVADKATFFRNYGDTTTTDPLGQDPRPNEIIHFKKYSPNNTYYGVPDIIAAKNALAGAEYADRFNLDYFEHKAVPRYVIVLKGAKLSPDAEQKMISFFRTGMKGTNHRTLYVPLPAGTDKEVDFKMQPVEAGIQDASFINYRKLNIDEILMAHRVPITKISMSDNMAVAAAADADKTFKEQVCAPWQGIVEKKINKIVAEKTDALKLKLNELSLTDAISQSQIDQRYAMIQVLTPNEIRKKMGMRGLSGGDKVVEKTPQQQADAQNNLRGTDARARERQNNQPDNPTTPETRKPKGEGRAAQ